MSKKIFLEIWKILERVEQLEDYMKDGNKNTQKLIFKIIYKRRLLSIYDQIPLPNSNAQLITTINNEQENISNAQPLLPI